MKLIAFALILLAGLLVVAQAPKGSAAELRALADQYFDQYFFPFNPTAGTVSGFHQYDNQLEDYSGAAVFRQVKMVQEYKKKCDAFDARQLDRESARDRQLLLGDINGRLLDLQSIRQWEHNPDRYSSGISGSIFVIMARNFAPADQRIKSVIARERQIPGVFVAARRNLKDVPQLYVDIAIEQIPGIIGFFEKDVPEAFKDVKDPKLLAEFRSVNAKVLDLLKQYQEFLTKEIKPKAKGDFRIGADNYRKKLLFDEAVDVPLERLLEIGMADLRRNQQAFTDVSSRIDPKKTPQQLLSELEKDHPAPDKLLQTFRDTLGGLRDFLQEHHIVKEPSQGLPILE